MSFSNASRYPAFTSDPVGKDAAAALFCSEFTKNALDLATSYVHNGMSQEILQRDIHLFNANSSIKTKIQTIEMLEGELKTLRAAVQMSSGDAYATTLKDMRTEIHDLMSSTDAQIAALREEVRVAKSACKAATDELYATTNKVADAAARLKSSESRASKLEAALFTAEAKMVMAEAGSSGMAEENARLLARAKEQVLEASNNDAAGARSELQSVRGELETVRGELENVRGEVENVRGELDATRKELISRPHAVDDDERSRASRTVRDLEHAVSELRAECSVLRAAQQSRDASSAEVADLRRKLDKAENTIELINTVKDDTKLKIASQASEITSLKSTTESQKSEIAAQKTEIKAYELEISRTEEFMDEVLAKAKVQMDAEASRIIELDRQRGVKCNDMLVKAYEDLLTKYHTLVSAYDGSAAANARLQVELAKLSGGDMPLFVAGTSSK